MGLVLLAALATATLPTQAVQIRAIDRPVYDVLQLVARQTGAKLDVENALSARNVTVLVRGEPADHVLGDVANVLRARWLDRDGTLVLGVDPDRKKSLDGFEDAEAKLQRARGLARLDALADAASGPYDDLAGTPDAQAAEPGTPRAWARERASDPMWYLAGRLWKNAADPVRQDLLQGEVTPFTCGPAFWPPAARIGLYETDPNVLRRFSGCQIVVRMNWAYGEPEVGAVDGPPPKAFKRDFVAPFPRIPAELAALPFAREAADWETDLDDPKAEIPSAALSGGTVPASVYPNGRYSLGDDLAWAFDQTKLSIVADSFRAAAQRPPGQDAPADARRWLQGLRKAERCFVRVENGRILVRHGGFWDLAAASDPVEREVRALEGLSRPLGIDDYADLAAQVFPRDGTTALYRRADAVLTRFDAHAFARALPALAAYTWLTDFQRRGVLAGGWADGTRNVIDTEGHTEGNGLMASTAALYGPFYGAAVVGEMARILELPAGPFGVLAGVPQKSILWPRPLGAADPANSADPVTTRWEVLQQASQAARDAAEGHPAFVLPFDVAWIVAGKASPPGGDGPVEGPITLHFGPNVIDGVAYTFDIP